MRRVIALFLLLLAVFAPVVEVRAETASAPAEAESGWEVTKISLHRDDGSGNPGEEVAYFHPEDHVHHVFVGFKSIEFGLIKPKSRFISINTAAGRDLLIAESESSTALLGNEFKGSLSLERDFPIGYYRFELEINGKSVAGANYCVMDKPENLKIFEYSLHLPDKDGDLGEEVKCFTTAHRHVFLSVRTSGLKPGTQLKWVWRGLDTEKGAGEVTSAEGRIQEVGVFNLSPDLTLQNALPIGSYSLEMYLDGSAVASFPFRVEE